MYYIIVYNICPKQRLGLGKQWRIQRVSEVSIETPLCWNNQFKYLFSSLKSEASFLRLIVLRSFVHTLSSKDD